MAKVTVSDEYRETCTHGEVRVNRHGTDKLATKVFVSDDNGFAVTNVIIMGKEKCAVFDTQWTKANALRALAEIVEENLELETIYLSHAHPDHYFGAEVLKQHFPDARVIAVPEEARIIQKQWAEKRNEVVPDIGEINYAAEQIPFVVEALQDDFFLLEGERIEVMDRLMGDYRYNTAVYVPSIDTLMCSDILFNEAHPFTCEITKEERAEWHEVCEKLKAMDASVVIPGHMRMGMPFDNTAFDWTMDYLEKTEIELIAAKSPGDFFFAMDRHFPNAILKKSNEMNSMVFFGGREWEWREDEVWK
ncbi:MAG: MBL fold metallo-hydrolase [Coriobacteriales bacterium]|jgi:glyoxylase-like metal-dependent hydrolase (beta-lactamase superfamily II)|nr:MBL fold metallo-hydrolase [Coriobacteriales bacterium]